ncbi:MAG: PQQ-binding-like beta-propeller repeat protein, partial [Thermoplasmata archaeon]
MDAYTVTAIPGYYADSYRGVVTVSGADPVVPITWTKVNYVVAFNETGLTPGTSWTVTLGGSPNSTAAPGNNTFLEPNGTYSYSIATISGYEATPASGSVMVSGANVTVSISYSVVVTYVVTFNETGLPPGTLWAVTLAGSTNTTAAPGNNTFDEPDGSYSCSVGAISGYEAAPCPASVVVAGVDLTVEIQFTPTYSVTFPESGLPPSTTWSVILGGSPNSTRAPGSNVFNEPTGDYAYSVGGVSGYTASPASGDVNVSTLDQAFPIQFTAVTTSGGTGAWPTYLGEVARDSAQTGTMTLSSSNAAKLGMLWSSSTGLKDPGYLQAEPVEANNTIYIGAGSGVFYALNATTGAVVWQSVNLGNDYRCNYPDGVTSTATVLGGEV